MIRISQKTLSLQSSVILRVYSTATLKADPKNVQRLVNQREPLVPLKDIPSNLKTLKERVKNGEVISKEEYLSSDHFKFKNEQDVKEKMGILKHNIDLINSNRPLICIDCEAFERNQKYITEIGISILNQTTPKTMVPQIKTYHIIIEDHLRKRNKLYVPDYKNNFLNGTSYIMSELKTKQFLQQFLEKYLMQKNGILVGHNLSSEVKFFKKLGIQLSQHSSIDTLSIHQLSRSNGGSLWAILRSLDIPYSYLHNAGNDAYYTLLVALSLLDPVIRINNNLDIYEIQKFSGKGQHHHKASVEKVVDVNKLIQTI